jgi:CheY-like chemotaxis protein
MTSMGYQPGDVSGVTELHPQASPVVVAIDDDASILLATAKALTSAGMVCHTATTGAEGLRLIRECHPDLVLLDILLIGEDGFTLCREIRRTWSPEELPVIMMTSLEETSAIPNLACAAGRPRYHRAQAGGGGPAGE